MVVIKPRPQLEVPRLVGRPPNDYVRQLQDYLESIDPGITALNLLLDALNLEAGGGTVTAETGSGLSEIFLLMGA